MKKTKKTKLTAALLLAFAAMPLDALAADFVESGDYIETQTISVNDNPFMEINYITDKSSIGDLVGQKPLWSIKYRDGDAISLIDAIKAGAQYWADMLGPYAKNKTPWQVFVTTDYQQNATAGSASLIVDAKGENAYQNGECYVADQIQSGRELNTLTPDIVKNGEVTQAGNYGFGNVTIGKFMGTDFKNKSLYGWYVDTDAALPTNESANDFIGTVRHEFGHALGISVATQYIDDEGNPVEGKDKETDAFGNVLAVIHPDITDSKSWTLHMYDQNGNPAKAGQRITTTEAFEALKEDNPNIKASDYFIVDKDITSDGKGFAYFVGDNVTKVLDGAKFFGRSGLPINGWERGEFEGSHLNTSGMMSHRPYSNYTNFMEAELAVMQDLGYTLDRKAYFGYSVYGNDGTINNTNGYSARNSDGTAYTNEYSLVPLGVGLHVYGSRNNITQAANVLTNGVGAVGVRVDGSENTINIAKDTKIHANGARGNGLMVSYGRNQVINQEGEVTATGENGVGARFDFGSSSNGAIDEYRGSYIRYKRSVDTDGEISSGENQNLFGMDAEAYNSDVNELNGPLVKEYNISGKLAGGSSGDDANAIYIAQNAFVKDINVNEGAEISGNITNSWKDFPGKGYVLPDSVGSSLKIQYGDGKTAENGYNFDSYIPDLTTNLNFNTNTSYKGNIFGPTNTKVNVNNMLIYGGEADVVNVTVAKDGAVFGGTYSVNDMSQKVASGFSDATTGQFINHGTIGANSKDSNLVIKNGTLVSDVTTKAKFVSDGTIIAVGGGSKGNIEVTGSADVTGSAVSAVNFIPGESKDVVTATDGVTGELAKTKDSSSGMMDVTSEVTSNALTVTATEANNLGDTTSEQESAYNAVNSMRQSLQASGDTESLDEMRTLYNLSADAAKSALSDIGSSNSADMAALTQQSDVANEIVGERMATAFNESVKTDNDIWVKFTKHWGEVRSGANYNSSAISGGYDKAVGRDWRFGGFIGYNATNLGMKNGGGNVYDTRVGVYGLYKRNAREGFIYADCGWLRNKVRKSIGILGLNSDTKYAGHIVELGGEYKQDIHNNKKMWRVAPYVNLQLSHLTQGGYTEEGLGIYSQNVKNLKNTYFAGQLGLELKRALKQGNYGMRLGVKHAFSGADPDLSYSFVGDSSTTNTIKGNQDKTHFILRLFGDLGLGGNWNLAGNARLQKGSHDRDIAASLTLKKSW